jgi:U4/U6 small nuclear ribonucleoprotein PRP3
MQAQFAMQQMQQMQQMRQGGMGTSANTTPLGVMGAAGVRKAPAFVPAPLLLDSSGREVDSTGRAVVSGGARPVTTLKINSAQVKEEKYNPYLAHRNGGANAAGGAGGGGGGGEGGGDGDGGGGGGGRAGYDASLAVKSGGRERGRRQFNFLEPGTHVRKAEAFRERWDQRTEERAAEGKTGTRASEVRVHMDIPAAAASSSASSSSTTTSTSSSSANGTALGGPRFKGEPLPPSRAATDDVPALEWWDVAFLDGEARALLNAQVAANKAKGKGKARAGGGGGDGGAGGGEGGGGEDDGRGGVTATYDDLAMTNCKTVEYVQHPVGVAPPVKKVEAKPQELLHTKKERKRIRRQERRARQKEEQDKIRLGLMDAPEPKVKIANMYQVLGDRGVMDPSAVERQVRKQIARRERDHEMRNAARKLTPEEKREKKMRKLQKDSAKETQAALFRVSDLSDGRNRYKVDIHAQEWLLTGCALTCKDGAWNMVVVEGGPKSIRNYVKLMTKRIKWGGSGEGNDDDDDEGEGGDSDDSEAGDGDGKQAARCELVWSGSLAKKSFSGFRFEECRTAATARRFMESRALSHYWDMVQGGGGEE